MTTFTRYKRQRGLALPVVVLVIIVVVPEVPGLGDPGAPGHPVAVITQDGHQPRAAQGRVQRAKVHDDMICVI